MAIKQIIMTFCNYFVHTNSTFTTLELKKYII